MSAFLAGLPEGWDVCHISELASQHHSQVSKWIGDVGLEFHVNTSILKQPANGHCQVVLVRNVLMPFVKRSIWKGRNCLIEFSFAAKEGLSIIATHGPPSETAARAHLHPADLAGLIRKREKSYPLICVGDHNVDVSPSCTSEQALRRRAKYIGFWNSRGLSVRMPIHATGAIPPSVKGIV